MSGPPPVDPRPAGRGADAAGRGADIDSRTKVLSAVRGALALHHPNPDTVHREADALLAGVAATRPALLAPDVLEAFIARATTPKVGATVARVGSPAQWPEGVRAYLVAQGLPPAIALQPAAALLALDWQGLVLHDALASDEAVAVAQARWGIAETGSLVFHSDPESPVLTHFLPLHEVVLLRVQDVLAYLEDYADAVAGQRPPRNANLVTGASGTTDIEGELVLGAHGPRRLHIVIAG